MIRLTCTQCKSPLEMDDAFAGGVCRCQFCGTIQTVPSHLKAAEVVATGPAGKSLYAGSGASSRNNGTGLYDLADVVASSGLSRSSLRGTPPTDAPQSSSPTPRRIPMLAIAGVGVVMLLLVGVIAFLLLHNGSSTGPAPAPSARVGGDATQNETPGPAPAPGPAAPAAVTGPHFFSLPISDGKIVYVVDRSDSSRRIFDSVKAGIFNSVESLGADRQFAVVFWGREGEDDWKDWAFPENGLAPATPQQTEKCRDKFADAQASGKTDLSGALNRAFSLHPDAIVLVTAKGINLQDDITAAVEKARRGTGIKVYTVDLSNGDAKAILQPIAAATGGTYTPIAPAELK